MTLGNDSAIVKRSTKKTENPSEKVFSEGKRPSVDFFGYSPQSGEPSKKRVRGGLQPNFREKDRIGPFESCTPRKSTLLESKRRVLRRTVILERKALLLEGETPYRRSRSSDEPISLGSPSLIFHEKTEDQLGPGQSGITPSQKLRIATLQAVVERRSGPLKSAFLQDIGRKKKSESRGSKRSPKKSGESQPMWKPFMAQKSPKGVAATKPSRKGDNRHL